MQPDTAETLPEKRKGKPVKGGVKARLLSLTDLDARTKACRQAVGLYEEYQEFARGTENGVDMREQAEAAAILGAMRKDRATRWYRGEDVPVAELCTLVNSENRVLANMREWRSKAGDTALNLSSYLQLKADEKAASGGEE